MKVLSLFSGIGAFEKALDRMGIPYELVGYCEIDKHASKSYAAIHGVPESMNLGDITKVDEKALPKDIDLCTYGFPCQDISICGKQKGLFNEDGTKTRSGLFFEALRIIEETQPRVAIAENVKNLVGKKFDEQFQVVLASLEAAGYNNYWMVLNAKDFGVPQNRERVFIVSIRKDVDTGAFNFPEGFPLELRLKDILEDEVEEKYYLSNDQMNSIIHWKAQQKPFEKVLGNRSISPTLTARGAGENHSGMIIYSLANEDTCNLQAEMESKFGIDKSKNAPQKIDVANCITAREDRGVSNRKAEGTAIVEPIVYDGFNQRVRADQSCVGTLTQNCGADLKRNGMGIIEAKINVVGNYSPSGHDASRIVSADGLAPTVKENHGPVTATVHNFRIRKLTPKECFRLMGFDDSDFEKAEAVNSNTQLYKQAGNSIVVPVIEHIFEALLECGALKK